MYLKINELKEGYLYSIQARNGHFGIWNSKIDAFEISRHKLGKNFVFEEYHIDCPAWATAMPLREIEKSPFTNEDFDRGEDLYSKKEEEILTYLNNFEEQKMKELEEWRNKTIDEFKRNMERY